MDIIHAFCFQVYFLVLSWSPLVLSPTYFYLSKFVFLNIYIERQCIPVHLSLKIHCLPSIPMISSSIQTPLLSSSYFACFLWSLATTVYGSHVGSLTNGYTTDDRLLPPLSFRSISSLGEFRDSDYQVTGQVLYRLSAGSYCCSGMVIAIAMSCHEDISHSFYLPAFTFSSFLFCGVLWVFMGVI